VNQIEDKFSPYAKETLAKLIAFLQVSFVYLFFAVLVVESVSQDEILPSIKLAYAQLPTDQARRWATIIPVIEELKVKAKKLGLWNLFLSKAHYPQHGVPLTNLEVRILHTVYGPLLMVRVKYAVMAEVLGRGGHLAPQAVNCSAPDTGNMGEPCWTC
jgi:acyl-CoA dehydrogenase